MEKTKDEVIKCLRQMFINHIDIKLHIAGGTAAWSHQDEPLTLLQTRVIGYVSGLAWGFNIVELVIDDDK